MAVTRIRVADTEAVAKYHIASTGIMIVKIVGLNYDGKGRRLINLHPDGQESLKKVLAEKATKNGK